MSEEWDGTILHRQKAGSTGWKRWHCRCPECREAGLEVRRRGRIRDQTTRGTVRLEAQYDHGLEGYKSFGCRCSICTSAGQNAGADEDRLIDARLYTSSRVDWDEFAHLRPGAGVRRKA